MVVEGAVGGSGGATRAAAADAHVVGKVIVLTNVHVAAEDVASKVGNNVTAQSVTILCCGKETHVH
jgi:shikimate 5-dehydrogenase